MAGNTRGKLKEHFEGIHRNFDWSTHHINTALTLIVNQLRQTQAVIDMQGDIEKEQEYIEAYPLFQGITALGEGITTLDGLAQDIYKSI